MRTRTQIEPNRFCPGKVSHERAAAAREFFRTPTSQPSQRRSGQQRRYCLATVPE
jgi:hypothetical protein